MNDRAFNLVNSFNTDNWDDAKAYALRCVDEMIKSHSILGETMYKLHGKDSYFDRCINFDMVHELEVLKQEINKQ